MVADRTDQAQTKTFFGSKTSDEGSGPLPAVTAVRRISSSVYPP